MLRILGEDVTKALKPKPSADKLFKDIIGSDTDRLGLYTTLPRNGSCPKPIQSLASLKNYYFLIKGTSNPSSLEYGSLKRRKPLKSASLSSLLVAREDSNQVHLSCTSQNEKTFWVWQPNNPWTQNNLFCCCRKSFLDQFSRSILKNLPPQTP